MYDTFRNYNLKTVFKKIQNNQFHAMLSLTVPYTKEEFIFDITDDKI